MGWRIFVREPVGSDGVVIAGVDSQNPTQMPLSQDTMVYAFAPDRSDQPFAKAVLPGDADISGTRERYAGDGVMVIFNDPVPSENPSRQAVLMALELRGASER